MNNANSVRLEGAPNYRDFGSYRTHSNRSLVTGKLFRSDALDKLTEQDQSHLVQTGLKTIIDLRGSIERDARPHALGAHSSAEVLSIPIAGDLRANHNNVLQRIIDNPDFEGCFSAMKFAYGEFPKLIASSLPQLFDILLDESSYPILIHCTAGKDRTGFLCAIIQFALGVPEETVYHDYCLTDEYCPFSQYPSVLSNEITKRTGIVLEQEAAKALKRSDRRYLEHAFNVINEEHGSLHQYLEEKAGLSKERLTQLEELLLV